MILYFILGALCMYLFHTLIEDILGLIDGVFCLIGKKLGAAMDRIDAKKEKPKHKKISGFVNSSEEDENL